MRPDFHAHHCKPQSTSCNAQLTIRPVPASLRRPPTLRLLLLACALTVTSCRDDQGAGARSERETPAPTEETSGGAGEDESARGLESLRPSEEPGVVTGATDERDDEVLHDDEDDPGSRDRFRGWRLSEEPIVAIGGADERESHLLHQVAGAARLGDGRIAVVNEGTLQLRYYDQAGNHLLDAGGAGEGPGELLSPLDHFTRLPGDSILVASWRSGFTRFGPDGRYAGSIPYELPPRGRCWQFAGNDLLPDGSLLLRYSGIGRFVDTGEPCPKTTEVRPPVVFGRYMPGTPTGIDTVAVMHGFERTGDPNDLYAYPKDAVFGIADDRLYMGDTGSGTILVISFGGDTIRTLPVPFEPAPVPADARASLFRDATITGREGTRTERMTFRYPDHYPRFARLVAAPGDRVWVMAYPPLKEPAHPEELVYPIGTHRLDEGARWGVVDTDGVFIAEVRTPPGFFVLEVGDDYVLGLHKDELHRESVRLHRLIR